MADRQFEDARLARVYDALDGDREDLVAYLALAREFDARRVVDVGCGTGAFALLLAGAGFDVVGVDPARASLDVARRRPGAGAVRWVHGTAGDLPSDLDAAADLVTMTGNVAQAITAPADWEATLAACARVLAPGGRLVFETRVTARAAWRDWTPERSRVVAEVPGVGRVTPSVSQSVTHWNEVTEVALPLVTFRGTWVFEPDGAVLTSDSTLRFRERAEVEGALRTHGFEVDDVRDAPDRPGLERVYVARRGENASAP